MSKSVSTFHKAVFKGSLNPESKIPKPEELLLNHKYAITISPSDTYQPDNIEPETLDEWSREIKRMFSNYFSCRLQLWIEYSKAFRLHFHGYITISNPTMFYFKDIRSLQLWSNVDIEIITDPLGWDLYIRKNHYNENMDQLVANSLTPYYDNWSLRIMKHK